MNIIPLKPQLLAAADPTVQRIIPDLAVEIGLNESIMLLQIAFWIHNSNNLRDDDWWTYQSVRTMHAEVFTYWSRSTINRTAQSLTKKNLIKVGNFNKRVGDDTQWYALNVEEIQKLRSIRVELVDSRLKTRHPVSKRDTLSQNETPSRFEVSQNETTLPENLQRESTETTQRERTLSDVPSDAAPPPIVVEEKPVTPSIQETSTAVKPKIDLWEYATKKVWTGGEKYWRNVLNMLSGRSKTGQWAEYNFEEEMRPKSPAVILAFKQFMETEEEYEGLTIPQKPETIYRYWGFFRQSKRFNNLVRIAESKLAALQEVLPTPPIEQPQQTVVETATAGTPVNFAGMTKETFSLEKAAELLRSKKYIPAPKKVG